MEPQGVYGQLRRKKSFRRIEDLRQSITRLGNPHRGAARAIISSFSALRITLNHIFWCAPARKGWLVMGSILCQM